MRKLFSSVAMVAMTQSPSFTTAQTVLEQSNHSGGVQPAQEHAGPQHDVSAETPPEAKAKADNTGPPGGTVQQVGELKVETIIEPGGLRLLITDRNGKKIDLSGARGLATLQIEGDAKRYRYDLFPDVGEDRQAEAMAVAVDLSRIAGRKVVLAFQLVGVDGAARHPIQFTTDTSVPLTEAQRAAAAIEAQKACPVSGQPLRSMGKAIPVALGEHTVYVCCEGCIAAVKAKPQKYLAMVSGSAGTVPPGSEEVRPGVYKVAAADQPFITAQQKCPVMDEPFDGMGGPYRVNVEGRAVYICCPDCAKKLKADPQSYLQKLASQGIEPPTVR